MNFQDVILDKWVTAPEIAKAVAFIFSVSEAEVLTTSDFPDTPLPESVKILCHLQKMDGEFPQQITFYVREPSVDPGRTLEVAGKLCEQIHCTCLLPNNETEDPYSMVLVRDTKNYQVVSISPTAMDEEGRIILSM